MVDITPITLSWKFQSGISCLLIKLWRELVCMLSYLFINDCRMKMSIKCMMIIIKLLMVVMLCRWSVYTILVSVVILSTSWPRNKWLVTVGWLALRYGPLNSDILFLSWVILFLFLQKLILSNSILYRDLSREERAKFGIADNQSDPV